MPETAAIEHVCLAWDTAVTVEPVPAIVPCLSAVVLPESNAHPRFAYASVGSPIEVVLHRTSTIASRAGGSLSVAELATRLLDGEVTAILAPADAAKPSSDEVLLPERFIARRQEVRSQNVLARFLIRQIGLEEVSSHRGAPAQLYRDLASLWSLDLALCTDPAMLLTLGADRQRYVDINFNERATDRLPRALGRLHDLGVRSYPRLVIV